MHGRESPIFEEGLSSRKNLLFDRAIHDPALTCCREELAQLSAGEPGSSTALQWDPGDF